MKRLNTLIAGAAFLCSGLAFSQPLYTQGGLVTPTGGPNPNVGIGVLNPVFFLDLFNAPGAPGVNLDCDEFRFGNGNNVFASQYSGVFGIANNITNSSPHSFAMGVNNVIDNGNDACFAAGANNQITTNNQSVVALGGNNQIMGNTVESAAIGEDNHIVNGHGSIALGGHNMNDGFYTITIGQGLNNNIANSIMAGFGGIPAVFVAPSNNVGIGNNLAPAQALDVNGTIRSSALAGGGNVVANAVGDLVIGPVVGDNLGNHIATMDLDMSCFDIVNTGDIKFCNGPWIDQTNFPGELVFQGGPVGIGINPSAVGFSPGGSPAQLAVAGEIWANGYWYASDKRFKQNITELPNALEMLQSFNGYSYEYMKAQYPEYNFPEGQTYGFLAQEVMTVAPGLVQQGENGYYSVNYLGVIPILTEAIKEQQDQIEERDAKIADLQYQMDEIRAEVAAICESGCYQAPANGGGNTSENNQSRLGNNTPNPFNGRTSIGYFVPETASSAYLSINDLNGKFIMKVDISTFGVDSKIELEAGSAGLNPGIYLYSLIVDNQVVESKQMIVTNN